MKTQTTHSTTIGQNTYTFDFDVESSVGVKPKLNIDVYVGNQKLERNQQYNVNMENKTITLIGVDFNQDDAIVIKRNTKISKPSVVYSTFNRFNPKTLNIVYSQLLFKCQELYDDTVVANDLLLDIFQNRDVNEIKDNIEKLLNDELFDSYVNTTDQLEQQYNIKVWQIQQLTNMYDSITDDLQFQENRIDNLTIDYTNLGNTITDISNNIDIKINEFNNRITAIENSITIDTSTIDTLKVGQIIALHPDTASIYSERLLIASGQTYGENNAQVSFLKDYYPVVNGFINIPDLTPFNITNYLKYYVVKSQNAITGTGLI